MLYAVIAQDGYLAAVKHLQLHHSVLFVGQEEEEEEDGESVGERSQEEGEVGVEAAANHRFVYFV